MIKKRIASNKELEARLQALEEFHYKVKLGQRWLICAAAVVGSIITSVWYLLASWHIIHEYK